MAAEAGSSGHFTYDGSLKGHGGWVTSLATPIGGSNQLLSASRDKTCIWWDLSNRHAQDGEYGAAKYRLEGHADAVADCALTSDGKYALTGSWDQTLRLWHLSGEGGKGGQCFTKFPRRHGDANAQTGHTKDVTSVSFSPTNRALVSAGRDKKIKMWNIVGDCKFTVSDQPHNDWVSCVRFSNDPTANVLVSGSWDQTVKVWDSSDMTCKATLAGVNGHTGYINTISLSPDGSLCASGGRDGKAKLWDITSQEFLYELEAGEQIHALAFSPVRYWLCAACQNSIKIWDLESKTTVAELVPELPVLGRKAMKPECISLAWSADGATLFSGYTDNTIRVWGVRDA